MTYGATDEFGWKGVDKRVHVHDLHATILYSDGHRPHQADISLQRPRFPADRRCRKRDPRHHCISFGSNNSGLSTFMNKTRIKSLDRAMGGHDN